MRKGQELDKVQMILFDRAMILDFYSLGAWLNQYTATALYKAAQQIPMDSTVPPNDKPRIQMALRAKILAEVVAAMETLGRFCYAVQHRSPDGFAANFVDMTTNRANDFYRSINMSAMSLIDRLNLPSLDELEKLHLKADIGGFFSALDEMLQLLAPAYDDNDTDHSQRRKLTQTYNAIKHGNHVVNNPEILAHPLSITLSQDPVAIIRRWPKCGDPIDETTMIFVERSMGMDAVKEDLDIVKKIAEALSNLCQLLIVLIDHKQLTYT